MEQIDVQNIQRMRSTVAGAWRRWEEDATTAPALQAALREAKEALASAEGSGAWQPTPGRRTLPPPWAHEAHRRDTIVLQPMILDAQIDPRS